MSGGSLDYIYSRLEDAACQIGGTPLRNAFAKHLVKVAKALHDIEWVMSCDKSPGDEDEAIRAVIHESAELEAAIAIANVVTEDLLAALKRAKK